MGTTIVPAGEYVIVASDAPDDWPFSVEPAAHFGHEPAFNNSGTDSVAIRNSTTIIDITAQYEGSSDYNGYAWKLDPAQLSAEANDEPENWCYSTVVFEQLGDAAEHGTPGAPNDSACEAL
jgi:hypothetical protein